MTSVVDARYGLHLESVLLFFKHFVGAHESNAMIEHMDRFGVEGYGRYFILMELCSEQLEKDKFETVTEAHCRFSFSLTKIRQRLRISQTKLGPWLDHCQTLGLLSYEIVGSRINIYVPKLLECLDRDFKRSRKQRAIDAQVTHTEEEIDKELEEEKEEEKGVSLSRPFDFDSAYQLYPSKLGKAEGLARLPKLITTQDQFDNFVRAVKNYSEHCKVTGTYAKYFSSFVGTKKSQPWTDYVDFTSSVNNQSKFNSASGRESRNLSAVEQAKRNAGVQS